MERTTGIEATPEPWQRRMKNVVSTDWIRVLGPEVHDGRGSRPADDPYGDRREPEAVGLNHTEDTRARRPQRGAKESLIWKDRAPARVRAGLQPPYAVWYNPGHPRPFSSPCQREDAKVYVGRLELLLGGALQEPLVSCAAEFSVSA